jgi:hypothetical protein
VIPTVSQALPAKSHALSEPYQRAFVAFAEPSRLPGSLSLAMNKPVFTAEPLAAATFSVIGLISRIFNYVLLGGTFPGVTGLMGGLGLGLALDAMVNQLDSHQFAHTDQETLQDHAKVGIVLGTSTVFKNAWLTTWKVQHPYHWTSKSLVLLDSLFSNQFRDQVISSAHHVVRNSFVTTEKGKAFHLACFATCVGN